MSDAEQLGTSQPEKRPRPEDDDNNCPSCAEEVVDDGVQCQWCGDWEHFKCAKISKQEYDMLSLNSPRIMFFCCECQPKVNSAFEFFDKMYARQDLFDKRLQRIEHKLNSLSEGVCEVQEGSELSTNTSDDNSVLPKPGLLPRVESLSVGGISSAVASVISEEKDKDKRKLNLILHNVVEPTADDGQTRKKEDIDHVSDIFHKSLGVPVQITNAIRLGKRGDKPRLLKVSVDSLKSKASILRNCTKLRGKDVPGRWSKVFITPDMTPKEREQNKSLRNQLADLNKNGREYRIKNGQIVRRSN